MYSNTTNLISSDDKPNDDIVLFTSSGNKELVVRVCVGTDNLAWTQIGVQQAFLLVIKINLDVSTCQGPIYRERKD